MSIDPKIDALLVEVWELRSRGDVDQAKAILEIAHLRAEKHDYDALGRIYHIYAQLSSDQNDTAEALTFWKKSLSYYEKEGIPAKIAHSKRHVADAQRACGDHEHAEQNYKAVLAFHRSNPEQDRLHFANALSSFARSLDAQGKAEASIALWREARQIYRSYHLTAGIEEAESRITAWEKSRTR